MPTYVYRFVESGETIEVQQAFTDDTLTEYTHPRSGEVLPVKKVFQPVGVTFKGSGFFKNDHRGSKGSSTTGSESSPSSTAGSGGGESSSSSGESGKSSSSSESSTTSTSSTSSSTPTSTPASSS